jgi:hypothetical protein
LNIDKEAEYQNINDRIDHLNMCYDWYINAYEARLKHRNYAFVPECYDFGHNLQFTIIQEKINLCEDKLFAIKQKHEESRDHLLDSKSDENRVSENADHQYDAHIKKAMKYVNTFKKKRLADEKETDQLIRQYIKENEVSLKYKQRIIDLCANFLKSFTDEYNEDFYIHVGIFHLIRELHCFGYFESNYRPIKCTECTCGSYVSRSVTLSCKCTMGHNNMKNYLHALSIESLKNLCRLMLTNKQKIEPLVADLILFYRIFDTHVLVMGMELTWDPMVGRLVLKEDSPKLEKASKFMASMRLKTKQYMAKRELDEIMYDDDDD